MHTSTFVGAVIMLATSVTAFAQARKLIRMKVGGDESIGKLDSN
jgi:hypothetical protein